MMNPSKYRSAVLVLACGGMFTLAVIALAIQPIRAAGPWYVAPGGDDSNDCQSSDMPCASINGAIANANGGDTIYVAVGTYTDTGDQVVLLDKDTTLSGGWDETFTTQSGTSTVDGEGVRQGMLVHPGVAVTVDHFVVQNGSRGIGNMGTVILNNSTVSGNAGRGYLGSGNLILNNSTVSGNTGGGIYSTGIVALNNSTVSGNSTSEQGGGIHNCDDATLILKSSTVSGNSAEDEGGGIYNVGGGSVILQNTILAGNTSSSGGPDCYPGISSSGFNLIGNSAGCSFSPDSGDLVDVDPRLWKLVGLPGYHPLQPVSPAIDAGNPAGCTDHLGSPLTTDQRGVARENRCDIGSYEYDPDHDPIRLVCLPLCARNYCPDLFDDFSNPASGWEVVDDSYVRTEYLNGEYRVLTKQSGDYYLFRAPTCDRQDYTVEVDARWVGTPGYSYGLLFGLTGDYSRYYLFEVNTDYKVFRVQRHDPSGPATVVPITSAPAIHGGTNSNHLKVTRKGSEITLEVNGTVLGTWPDGTIGGLTGAGLATNPYPNIATSDARFDNFAVASLPGGDASVQGPTGALDEVSGLAVPDTWRDPEPADMGW